MNYHDTTLELNDMDVDVTVEYDYHRGEPAVWSYRNGDPGHPGTGDEVEIIAMVDENGKDWLNDVEANYSAQYDRIEAEIYEKHE